MCIILTPIMDALVALVPDIPAPCLAQLLQLLSKDILKQAIVFDANEAGNETHYYLNANASNGIADAICFYFQRYDDDDTIGVNGFSDMVQINKDHWMFPMLVSLITNIDDINVM